jgi:integrase
MAGVLDGHSHRLRDTFSVDLLENGVLLETVSILLGHKGHPRDAAALQPVDKNSPGCA